MAVWRCSGILPSRVFLTCLEDNLISLIGYMESLSENEGNRMLVFWILWLVWKSRNEFIFTKRNMHPIEDVGRAIDANLEWHRNVIYIPPGRRKATAKSSKWIPPPSGWLKCNFDYSSNSVNTLDGIGWILRDDGGRFLGAGSIQIQKQQTSLEGEALPFLLAMQQMWIRGWRQIWFESDNQELCMIINQVKKHMELGNLLCDVRHWMSRNVRWIMLIENEIKLRT